MADGTFSVRLLCEIAEKRGLMVDMHCDESDDPHSRHIETLAYETNGLALRAGLRVLTLHPCIVWAIITSQNLSR